MTFPNVRFLLYRYLLGECTDEEQRIVEERLLIDDDYRERLRETEPELMAAYVSGYLTLDKREKFDTHFLDSEERVKKLGFAAALYERANAGAARFCSPDDHLRRYLLGELSANEQLKVEERLLTDDDYKKWLETTEHGLIADYVREDLTEAEREMFESHFLRFEGRKEKLKFAEVVCEYYEYVQWFEAQRDASAKWFDRLRRWLAEPVNLSAWHWTDSK
jgi:hypothetical protein